jgi:hypothetical protein
MWTRQDESTYDPESLITGAEVEAGATYKDARQWPDQHTAERAYSGQLTPDEIAKLAPRLPGMGQGSPAQLADVPQEALGG